MQEKRGTKDGKLYQVHSVGGEGRYLEDFG